MVVHADLPGRGLDGLFDEVDEVGRAQFTQRLEGL